MKLRVIVILVMALCVAASSASALSIGAFFDPGGATCSTSQASFAPGTLYILTVLGGPAAGGISGAEFRMDGFPVGWFGSPTPNPLANVTVGGPTVGGCNIAFPNCQVGLGGVVLLYTIGYFATSQVNDNYLSILRHTTPTNPQFQCPLVTLCNAPVFTAVCVGGGQGIINPAGGSPCRVAVEQKTWSDVKSLYKN